MKRIVVMFVFFFLMTGATCSTDLSDEDAGIVIEKDIFPGRASKLSGDTPDQYILRLDNGKGHTFIVSFGDSLWAYEEWQRVQLGYFCEETNKKGFTRWRCEAQMESGG